MSGLKTGDDLDYQIVYRGSNTGPFPLLGEDAVDAVHLALFPFLDILKHTWFETGMLLHGQGDEQVTELLFYTTLVIEQFFQVLSLHRFECDAEAVSGVKALLEDQLGDTTGLLVLGYLTECAAQNSSRSAEGSVDEEL